MSRGMSSRPQTSTRRSLIALIWLARLRFGAIGGVALLGAFALVVAPADAEARKPSKKKGKKKAPKDTPEEGEAAEVAPDEPRTKEPPKEVTLSFRTSPGVAANVYWGKQLLGTTPFTLVRPYDSGPLDVVVRAGGFLPVHTRAYTFKNDNLTIRLTPTTQAHTLFGYREPVDEEPLEGADEDAPLPEKSGTSNQPDPSKGKDAGAGKESP